MLLGGKVKTKNRNNIVTNLLKTLKNGPHQIFFQKKKKKKEVASLPTDVQAGSLTS